MKKKSKYGFLKYIGISTLILAGGFLYQDYLYSTGKGYRMWDIQAIVCFIMFSIAYFILWITEKK
jgi:hypothetical protein